VLAGSGPVPRKYGTRANVEKNLASIEMMLTIVHGQIIQAIALKAKIELEVDATLVRKLEKEPQGTDQHTADADTAASLAAPSSAADTVPLDQIPAVPDMDSGKGELDAQTHQCPEPAAGGDDDGDFFGNGNVDEDPPVDQEPNDNEEGVDFGDWTIDDMFPERVLPNPDDLAFIHGQFPSEVNYDTWMDAYEDERFRNMHAEQIAMLRDALTNANAGDTAANDANDGDANADDSKAPDDSNVE